MIRLAALAPLLLCLLIETLGKQLKGDVRLTYQPTGFVYAFDCRSLL
jgi:hypothetical protein